METKFLCAADVARQAFEGVRFGRRERHRLMYAVEAMNGPLDGKRWPFERDITIGRDESAVGAALTTDRAVSRRHASVAIVDGMVELTDAGSSNGTLVGGEAIAVPVRIPFGEPFRVGTTMLRVLDIEDES